MTNERLLQHKKEWSNTQRSGYVPQPDAGEGAVRIVNGANETVPPFSAGQISACNNASGFPVYTIVKPTANSVNAVIFTGPHAIEANGAATGTLGYFRGGIAACYAGNLASNGIEASVGTANGSWTLAANNSGFITLGANVTEGLCYVRPFSSSTNIVIELQANGVQTTANSGYIFYTLPVPVNCNAIPITSSGLSAFLYGGNGVQPSIYIKSLDANVAANGTVYVEFYDSVNTFCQISLRIPTDITLASNEYVVGGISASNGPLYLGEVARSTGSGSNDIRYIKVSTTWSSTCNMAFNGKYIVIVDSPKTPGL